MGTVRPEFYMDVHMDESIPLPNVGPLSLVGSPVKGGYIIPWIPNGTARTSDAIPKPRTGTMGGRRCGFVGTVGGRVAEGWWGGVRTSASWVRSALTKGRGYRGVS